ncbi:hypothetical protein BKK81_00020 [Cupriavidus sp. USMAHM13]|nr:hypothetical protein BKK81_00020 [Cupriavidus sp. USMAHM13]
MLQNNQQIYNLIYAHTQGPGPLQPYVQFTHVPSLPTQGTGAASTYGAALLMSYDFGNAATPAALRLPGFKLPLRLEYIASTGDAASGAANLLYGPGSAAWSLTLTRPTSTSASSRGSNCPTWARARRRPDWRSGADGNRRGQVRGVLEVGMLM